jgi:hypothetical protein
MLGVLFQLSARIVGGIEGGAAQIEIFSFRADF